MERNKKMTLGLSAAALALAAGIGVAGMASATTTPTPTPSASAGASADGGAGAPDRMGRHGGRSGHGLEEASELAAKLGVDEAKVTEALKAFREANSPSTPPAEGQKPDPAERQAALAKSLAASLGIDESKVTAALQELRGEEQAEHAAALKTRLDKAVADGKLTQAEADAVTKAVQNGVIGGGGRW